MADLSEAVRFFESLAPSFDTSGPLLWGFLLGRVPEDRVGPLMDEIRGLGFNEPEPMLEEADQGRYILGFQEVCTHTAESFARRVEVVELLANRERLEVYDYSAGCPELNA